jgi:hypothetical protein
MVKLFRYGAMVLLPLCLAALPGCSGQRTSAAGHVPPFSLNTPVKTIAADEHGKAVLNRDVPGLMASQSYILFDDMSLAQIATVSGGQLTKAKLDLVQADLAGLP